MKITKRLLINLGFKKFGRDIFAISMPVGNLSCQLEKGGKITVRMANDFESTHTLTAEDLFRVVCAHCFDLGKYVTKNKMAQFIGINL